MKKDSRLLDSNNGLYCSSQFYFKQSFEKCLFLVIYNRLISNMYMGLGKLVFIVLKNRRKFKQSSYLKDAWTLSNSLACNFLPFPNTVLLLVSVVIKDTGSVLA